MGLTPKQAAAYVNAMHATIVARRNGTAGVTGTATLHSYFRGEQPLVYASQEWRKFHADRFREFSDNWCDVVARAAPERTEVFGLRIGDDVDTQSAEEKSLWGDWLINDGPAKSAQGYLEGAIASTSYAMVWGTPDDEPLLTWETADQAIVAYDPETGAALRGLKTWADDAGEYATLYTPDEVWKFRRPRTFMGGSGIILPAGVSSSILDGGWSARSDSDAETVIPNPLGVIPLVEHPNRPLLRSGPISDIAGVAAMQDAINLFWAYLFGAADFASLPARVVMGQEPPTMPILNAEGVVIGQQPIDVDALTHGRLLYLTGQNTTISSWDSAKLDVFTDVLNVMVKHVASQTQTPIHYIMGELGNVNGETLTATELPLATKVRQGHKHLSSPTRGIFQRFALVRGDAGVAASCRTAVVQWKNPETMSDAQVSDAATKDAAIGWPFAAILERRYGLSQPEIARTIAQRDAEAMDGLVRDVLQPPKATPAAQVEADVEAVDASVGA